MTISELLQKAHLRKFKDTDYPETSSEDFKVRLAMANEGLGEWEREVFGGAQWSELAKTYTTNGTGTGIDDLPTDFLDFIYDENSAAKITSGNRQWVEVSLADGVEKEQAGEVNSYVFWIEGGKIRSLPVLSGTFTLPYMRKITRYETGSETAHIECDTDFLLEYVIAQMFLDDKNFAAYQIHLQNAKNILDTQKYRLLVEKSYENP